ncbi:IclR family transcriptional regulator [Paenibacillus aestuarii]|uniref:IclR family transcriptional regulator n=1 Tax=Paenibacillus aestuarii TaxID=516965 RepID=A0ABW0K8C5_9BACL|nr:IclR family transcriptional regulator [Paenibacillus aestuarii]
MARRVITTGESKDKVASSTVLKALNVLHVLSELCDQQLDGASVSQISRLSNESPSSVCKHLAAFQKMGLVEQDSHTERYRIGVYSLRLAAIAQKTLNVRDIAAPYLKKIADQFGETVHLVVRDGHQVVYVDKVESSKTIRMHSQIGLRNPMYCTGVGKAILAFSPLSLVDEIAADGFTAYTPSTLVTREDLLRDLEQIRRRGYSIDDGEHESDVRCAAAPIFNHLNEPVASLSISGPKWRINDSLLQEFGLTVHDVALHISRGLGCVQ